MTYLPKILVDTNTYLRFILKDNILQFKKSDNLFRRAADGKLQVITPSIVVFEVSFILSKYYGLKKNDCIVKLKTIISADFLGIEDRLVFLKALSRYKDSKLSLVDCYLIEKADCLGAKIFTFDKDLENALE